MTDMESRSKADMEWENRTLCSDESCIGVIGSDGLCKECGKPFEGEFKPSKVVDDFDDTEDEIEDRPEALFEEGSDDEPDIDWENRTLCADESCIGVIGPDGRCKECGKSLDDHVEA